MWILIGSGAGALVLLGCCCLGGVGGWFFFLRSTPAKAIIGTWVVDQEAMKTNSKNWDKSQEELTSKVVFDFKSGSYSFTMPRSNGWSVYRVLRTSGNTVTLEGSGPSKRFDVEVIDSDHIKFVPPELGADARPVFSEPLYFKRKT